MAGHSKWANIQHRKGAQDAKKAKVFTKFIREITVAARLAGGDPATNPRLRLVMDKALAVNMPKDNIERAIKRGTGGGADANLDELSYEGYGPGGVAVLVACLTDNRNRTVSEVRHAFTKCGGSLGTEGSVAYLFTKKGQLLFAPDSNEEQIMHLALEAGAEDVITAAEGITVITAPEQFVEVKAAFTTAAVPVQQAEITLVPTTETTVSGETAEKLMKLLDMLEDLDDVQNVYCNAGFA